MSRTAWSLAVSIVVAASCSSVAPNGPWTRAELGRYHRAITTDSPDAQRWFDQGLVLCFAFDHEVARDSFAKAAEADPDCAMAYWGRAYAFGPHINNPAMDEDSSRYAVEEIEKAKARVEHASALERDLIDALSKRYAWPAPADRHELDLAYAQAMREVARKYPQDDDVATLFAESLMDLRPWDLWGQDGEPRPETPEVIAALEGVLARTPDHPGAAHFFIHTLEASSEPQRAVPAANTLRTRIPGSSHLVHMPAHIDIRVGNYLGAIESNRAATRADRVRVERAGAGGFYAIYRAHNYHFLMWAAMFDGQRAVALQAARDVVDQIPMEVVRQMPEFLAGSLASPHHAMVRFGMWDEILREPQPAEDLFGTLATWRYARTLAFGALGRVDEAVAEQAQFEAACERVPESYTVGNNSYRTVLAVAREMVAGEVEYRRGDFDVAFDHLRNAVKQDDALRYDEPWGWVQPARHALGALLLEQGRLEEAEQVYRTDLVRHPLNGWAIHGLAECMRRTGREAKARELDTAFRRAWARSDIELNASCFCRRGA